MAPPVFGRLKEAAATLSLLLGSFPEDKPTNFYVGVTEQSSEPTLLVQYLLANLTGGTINVTEENCQNQRLNEDDKESKHVTAGVRMSMSTNVGDILLKPLCPLRSDVLLHVGPRRRPPQQHGEGGLLRPLHGPPVQSAVAGLRPARGVHLRRILHVDRVQVEGDQRAHLPGGQSRLGGRRVRVRAYAAIHGRQRTLEYLEYRDYATVCTELVERFLKARNLHVKAMFLPLR